VVNAFVRLRQIVEHHHDIAAPMEKRRRHERTAPVIGILVLRISTSFPAR
jgi:hypothetical protein